ncbi:hypothetical protein N3K66_006095 [Trichothecium roseum]|uniref:Uncharacterized protein n=1 Tax=Trichothecium roseum TaxID=47278 RepID=A0ACC0UZP8_9HYPO|nr:hypothetical protein N3K66_006095 [Trichothecium roseum]
MQSPVIHQDRVGSVSSGSSSYHTSSSTGSQHNTSGSTGSYRAREYQSRGYSTHITNSGSNTIVHHGQSTGQYGGASGYSQGASPYSSGRASSGHKH